MTRSEGDRVLTDSDIAELIAWRRDLHRRPELSGDERQTAARVAAAMRHAGADRIATGLGGFGRDSGRTLSRHLFASTCF